MPPHPGKNSSNSYDGNRAQSEASIPCRKASETPRLAIVVILSAVSIGILLQMISLKIEAAGVDWVTMILG
jgi:hypothetical protein